MWDIGLSVFLALSGVSVVDSPRDCRDQPGLMGGYITGTNLIELCHANVLKPNCSEDNKYPKGSPTS